MVRNRATFVALINPNVGDCTRERFATAGADRFDFRVTERRLVTTHTTREVGLGTNALAGASG
jgi:hypothetical protein